MSGEFLCKYENKTVLSFSSLFRKEKTKRYGKTTDDVDMIANVEEMMKGMTNIKHQCTNTSNGSVVALITPLMARCHTLK